MDSNFSTNTTDEQPTKIKKKADKNKQNGKNIKRSPLRRPSLRVDMVAFCAVISAACLPVVFLTQLALVALVNGRSISYFTLPDGSTTLAQLKPSSVRAKKTVEIFVLSIATNITTWQVRKANTTVAVGSKKMPMLPFLSFYAFDESIRLAKLKESAELIPQTVIDGKVETTFKVKHLRAEKVTGTENWRVSVIGYILPYAPGVGDGTGSIFKKIFYITPLDDIPVLPAAKIKDVDESYKQAVGTVMSARLNITRMDEMPDTEFASITGAAPPSVVSSPPPTSNSPPASTPPRASPLSSSSPQPTNSPTPKSTPSPGTPGDSAKPFTKK